MRHELGGLRLPLGHVHTQGLGHGLRLAPGFGGHHFNTLGQQHGGFALHLGLVLQVFNQAHALGNLHLQAGQGLFAQGRTCFGCVALPGHGIGNIEFGQVQQSLAFERPFSRHGFLQLGALGVIEPLAQKLGRTLVAAAEFPKHFGQNVVARIGKQPLPNAAGTFASGGGGESAASDFVQLRQIGSFVCGSRRHVEPLKEGKQK